VSNLDSTSVYSTAYLLGAYGVIDRVNPFIYNLAFGMEQIFETEEVYFDKVERARRLAPLIYPSDIGKAERLRGYNASSIVPAYVKPKHVIEPNRMLKRRPGERLLGDMSPAERRDAIILDTLKIEDDQISRREEYMAVQLLLSGGLTLSGPDYPSRIAVDLQRNSAHTVVLTGGNAWGQTGIDALDNLRTWGATVQKNSGFHPSVVVLDPLAANLLIKSPGIQQIMNSFRQTKGNIDLGGVVVGGLGREAKFLGDTGEFEFWVYQQYFTDDQGNVTQFVPDHTVMMLDPVGCQGTRLYGAIQDVRALRAMPRFPKNWISEDPSAEYLMTQSAPLPVLGWVDATFAATVA
jgi:hypothetical protein